MKLLFLLSCSCADLTSSPTLLQRFIAQGIFEDGQTSAEGQPDRAESDADDNEFSDADDDDTPGRVASLGMGFKRPGAPDSLQKFMDEWDDDSSASDLGADSHPAREETDRPKRTRDEAEHVGEGPSRRHPAKGQGATKKAKAQPARGTLVEAPLDIPPLRYMMLGCRLWMGKFFSSPDALASCTLLLFLCLIFLSLFF